MTKQKIENINIKELSLWTENPRDPISDDADAQTILNLAIDKHRGKWNLDKLCKQMGDEYDLSELPTVVYHGEKPVVYDGNRRVLLGKIYNKLISHELINWELYT